MALKEEGNLDAETYTEGGWCEETWDTQGGRPYEHQGGDWSKEHQGLPAIVRTWNGQGRILVSSLQRKNDLAYTLASEFNLPEL